MDLHDIERRIIITVRRLNSADYGSESDDFKGGFDTARSDAIDAIEEGFAAIRSLLTTIP